MNPSQHPTYVLMMVTSDDGAPSLEQAAKRLGLAPAALDASYGVVTINPERGLYGVRVDRAQLPDGGEGGDEGFSDPPIAPFGPD